MMDGHRQCNLHLLIQQLKYIAIMAGLNEHNTLLFISSEYFQYKVVLEKRVFHLFAPSLKVIFS